MEEVDKLAKEEAERQAEINLKRRKYMRASERFAQKPTIDEDTYKGKLKILKDVEAEKYPLPKNFPTTAELKKKFFETKSPDYKKTHERRNELLGKRLVDAAAFLDVDPDV